MRTYNAESQKRLYNIKENDSVLRGYCTFLWATTEQPCRWTKSLLNTFDPIVFYLIPLDICCYFNIFYASWSTHTWYFTCAFLHFAVSSGWNRINRLLQLALKDFFIFLNSTNFPHPRKEEWKCSVATYTIGWSDF